MSGGIPRPPIPNFQADFMRQVLNASPGEVLRMPPNRTPQEMFGMLHQNPNAAMNRYLDFGDRLRNMAAPPPTQEQTWKREADAEVDSLCPVLSEPAPEPYVPSRWLRFLYWLAKKLDHPALRMN